MTTTGAVRVYENRDRDAVVETVRTVFEEYGFGWEPDGYTRDLYEVPQRYQGDRGQFWVAESEGEVVGCGGLTVFPMIPGEPGTTIEHNGQVRVAAADCELMRLYVHPKGRGKGLGKLLFEQTIREAQARSRTRMEIWSDRLLTTAHEMYRRYGAVTVGERICPPPDETPEWGMMLELARLQRTLGA